MKWFGPTWNAPICMSETKAATPVGRACAACGIEIKGGDRGMLIPTVFDDGIEPPETTSLPWHLACMLRTVCAPVVSLPDLLAEAATKADTTECPYCKAEVQKSHDPGRYTNGIEPKDKSKKGCEFCDPHPLKDEDDG